MQIAKLLVGRSVSALSAALYIDPFALGEVTRLSPFGTIPCWWN